MLTLLIAALLTPPPAGAPAEPPADPPAAETPPPPVLDKPVGTPPEQAPPVDSPAEAAAEEEEKAAWQEEGWGWGALPAVNFNSDDGFGFGAIGNIYRYDGETAPYRADLGFLIFFTTKGSQVHRLNLDLLRVADTPLRLTTRVQFQATRVRNYCGIVPPGDCDEDEAEAVAEGRGLTAGTTEYEDFVRQYYLVRMTDPYLFLNGRYALANAGPFKVEAFGSYFGQLILPGDLGNDTSYPGSRYDQDFGTSEEGFLSVLQAGIMFDSRDNEPSPTSGAWLEASVRGTGPWLGSDWEYVGFNTTLRAYTPLGSKRVVLTDRLVLDGIAGDTYTGDLARAGGSQIYDFFGGQRAGRGIRASRVLGKARALNQTEVRATVWSPRPFGVLVDITLVGFFDIGYWAKDFGSIGGDDAALVWGTGGGFRIAANKNFIVRFDLGFSPLEDFAPSIYIDLANLW